MLTSSISDEALESCTRKCYDEIVLPDGECADSAKSGAEGAFEKLISSQRERRNRQGARTRTDSSEHFDKILELYGHEVLKQEINESEYDKAFKRSLENPPDFWAEVGHRLSWFKPWDKVLDDSNPPFTKWFVGGMLNACYNAVDRHVENGFGERVALIHDSPVTSSIRRITYSQLLEKVSLLAGVYSKIGVKKGGMVLIYMPMIPEAIISMLAAARLGAIHSVVFGGFAARELQTRIEHAEPTVIVAANCGVEPNKIVPYRSILKEALLHSCFKPSHIIIYERPEIKLEGNKYEHTFGGSIIELDWKESLKTAIHHDCIPVEANDPLYILYTSGTTDQPKGVVRPVGGHLATLAWTMHAVYGMGCPHQNLVNLPRRTNKEMDLECSYQKLPVEITKKYEVRGRWRNDKLTGESSPDDNEKMNDSSTSYHQQRINIKSKINLSCGDSLKTGDDFNCSIPSLPEDGKLKNNPNKLQEMSSDANSHNFLYNLCLKACQSLRGTKNKSVASQSSIKCLIKNHDHHGLKQRVKKDKHAVSPEGHSVKDKVSLPSISNSSVNKNVQSCHHKVSKCSEVNCLQDDSCKHSRESENEEVDNKFLPTDQEKDLTNSMNHINELTAISSTTIKFDMRESEVSQEHSERMSNSSINHSPAHLKCGLKTNCLHEKEIEMSNNSHAGIKISKIKSQVCNSDQICCSENSIIFPPEDLRNQKCPHENNVWWAASDMGWVVGHSYVCYAPLTAGLTSVMYEGKPDRTPDPGQYFRVIEEHQVNALLTAPTALRVIKRVDPNAVHGKKYSTKSLKTIFVAGESLDQSTKNWAEETFKVGVVNHWWQTETGHSITATFLGLGHSPNDPPGLSTGKSCPGFDLRILRDDGSEAAVGEEGRIAARLPLPPGTLSNLYKNPENFQHLYFSTFPGYYDTMDAGYVSPDAKSGYGWIVVTGREDDVVSVAGHRLSASAIESVALQHPDVGDALVVGFPDCTKGEVPLCLYVPTPKWKRNGESDEDAAQRVSENLIRMVRELVGPIAAFHLAFPVPALPKTRSGKIPRKSIARMARGLPLKIPPTVEDPLVYEDIKTVLQNMRLCQIK